MTVFSFHWLGKREFGQFTSSIPGGPASPPSPYMVLNPEKCYYMTLDLSTTKNEFVLEDNTVFLYAEEHVVLGITIDSRLTFHTHQQLCKKVANKLNALTRK